MVSRKAYEGGGDSAPLQVEPDLGVQQERVVATIPRDVHETDGSSICEVSGRPPEAVGSDAIPPAGLGVPAVGSSQGVDFIVTDGEAPAVPDNTTNQEINRLPAEPPLRPGSIVGWTRTGGALARWSYSARRRAGSMTKVASIDGTRCLRAVLGASRP